MREAVDWVVAALSGTAAPDDVAARLAARLVARGDIAAVLAGNRRFAAFREHPAAVENVEPRRPWSARAVVRTGPQLWEVDVTVEAEPPHRISSFQPRPVAADAVEWARIAAALRKSDHFASPDDTQPPAHWVHCTSSTLWRSSSLVTQSTSATPLTVSVKKRSSSTTTCSLPGAV